MVFSVQNKIIGLNINPNSQATSYNSSLSQNSYMQAKNTVSFTQEPESKQPQQPQQPKKEENKRGIGHIIKVVTNELGVAAFIGSIAACTIYAMRRPWAEKMAEKLEKDLSATRTCEKIDAAQKDLDVYDQQSNRSTASKILRELDPRRMAYRVGLMIYKAKNVGAELFNNIVYGVGTVIVMPLVVLFSPFGKKNSATDDKVFTVFRQPLSFALLFSMQLAVDKFLSKMALPRIKAKHLLEKPELYKDADRTELKTKIVDGKEVVDEDVLKEVRFDQLPHKKAFKESFSKLWEEIRKVNPKMEEEIPDTVLAKLYSTKEPDLNIIVDALKSALADPKYGNAAAFLTDLNNPAVKKTLTHLQYFIRAGKRASVLSDAFSILANIFFSIPIGCTALNVAYGEFMKDFGPEITRKSKIYDDKKAAKKALKRGGNNANQ